MLGWLKRTLGFAEAPAEFEGEPVALPPLDEARIERELRTALLGDQRKLQRLLEDTARRYPHGTRAAHLQTVLDELRRDRGR